MMTYTVSYSVAYEGVTEIYGLSLLEVAEWMKNNALAYNYDYGNVSIRPEGGEVCAYDLMRRYEEKSLTEKD